uniref:Uncharacterized protein n=1 Tax=Nelumbo nucifera TaxID=4432 RepID=A0A822YZF3_NELNU|nr:TPA_asm: hypothetical protein HUJ06_008547 [Nelumbo nucifera]DAD37910.1 TPA_asm: hypothetical protein HUJ06_008551 [Nelumbo nucifera]
MLVLLGGITYNKKGINVTRKVLRTVKGVGWDVSAIGNGLCAFFLS